jgi:hypothetical protein
MPYRLFDFDINCDEYCPYKTIDCNPCHFNIAGDCIGRRCPYMMEPECETCLVGDFIKRLIEVCEVGCCERQCFETSDGMCR